LFNIGSEQANSPAVGVSLLKARPVTVSSEGGCSRPVISTYWNPWKVKRGNQVSRPPPRQM